MLTAPMSTPKEDAEYIRLADAVRLLRLFGEAYRLRGRGARLEHLVRGIACALPACWSGTAPPSG